MKKIILIFTILVSTLALISCEGPMGPAGPAGPGSGSYWASKSFVVQPNQWNAYGTSGQEDAEFFYTVAMKELDEIAFKEGIVSVFIEVGNTKIAMPYSNYHVENDGYQWFETYSYDYEIGYVTFSVRYSDNFLDQSPIVPIKFYVSIASPD